MDWRRRPSRNPADPHGVADFLARAFAAAGVAASASPVRGTRFLTSTKEMLRISRTIEAAALNSPGGVVHAGFQQIERADAQSDLYASIVSQGTTVHRYAIDAPDEDGWTRVEDDTGHSVESQWFLLRRTDDEAVVLVGFEVPSSDDDDRRWWEGFTSEDPRLVDALADHLDRVRLAAGAGADRR